MKRIRIKSKISKHFIEGYDGPFKGYKTPKVHLGAYISKDLNIGKLNLNNHLPTITSNKYMSQIVYTILLNGCA